MIRYSIKSVFEHLVGTNCGRKHKTVFQMSFTYQVCRQICTIYVSLNKNDDSSYDIILHIFVIYIMKYFSVVKHCLRELFNMKFNHKTDIKHHLSAKCVNDIK